MMCVLQNVYYITVAEHTSAELEVGSMIQFGNPVKYGVIRRIEVANGTTKGLAEVETVSHYCIYCRLYCM